MAVHKWRKRTTKYFGEVWVPFAQIDLLATDNKTWHSLAVQVDSGAVVSLFRRSVADLLGIELKSGRRVELGSVGGSNTEAFVHEVQTRFDQNIAYKVPFAIAATENVPNLLGRLSVFDRLQVDFDGTIQETRVSPPWLDRGDRRIIDALLDASKHVLSRWDDLGLGGPLKEAARRLVQRNSQLLAVGLGLLKLHRAFEAPLVLRSMFEISGQLEFIVRDPATCLKLAQQYLDFEHVTRHRLSRAIVENPMGYIGRHVAGSPLRNYGEMRNEQEYQRVVNQFRKANGKVWDKWYCMSFRDLTRAIGWEEEYKHVYAIGSAWAHGDPSLAGQVAGFGQASAKSLLIWGCSYYARMLQRISGKIILTNEQHDVLNELSKGRFE